MKHFILKLTLFLTPLVVMFFIMELGIRNIPNNYNYKKKYLDSNASKIKTLILGSSHAYYGINPDYFEDTAFNASHTSQSLNYDYAIYTKYKDEMINLRTIVIPISYFTLFSNIEMGIESWRVKNYAIYYGIKKSPHIKDYFELTTISMRENYTRLISYYVKNHSEVNCNRLGWGTDYNSKDSKNLNETGKLSAKRHSIANIGSIENKELFDENYSIIDSIVNTCIKKDISVLIIMPPAYKTYRENLDSGQLQITTDAINKLLHQYKNCNYLNLIDDKRFVPDDFYDGDHMNEIGAKKLSQIIDSTIVKNTNIQ